MVLMFLMAVVTVSALSLSWSDLCADARAQEATAKDDPDDVDAEESGVFLATDREREREFDRALRLIADSRWSDAATLLDKILGADRDVFFKSDGKGGRARGATWRSVKTETARLIDGLPKAGRDAYALQFRARAERLLTDAVAVGDAAGIVAVARRWFHTPAGERAALLAAIEALESGQPLAAAAWLDRLAKTENAARYEPTLSAMRAVAWYRAGDAAVAVQILDKAARGQPATLRIAGRDEPLSFPPGQALPWLERVAGTASRAATPGDEWRMPRGDPGRTAVARATRPLLVPRYRVPLTRHPEERRLLEDRRKSFADRELPLLPAGIPLAVDGLILVHTPLGLLAVDFDTGKRMWMQPGAAAALPDTAGADDASDATLQRSLARSFDDATSGTVSSDGRLVFVVDSPPAAAAPVTINAGGLGFGMQPRQPDGWQGGNTLSAYDVTAKGGLRWRLPAREDADRAGPLPAGSDKSSTWYAGAPLIVGDRLFVLVEEKSEIRLDVLDAADGSTVWSQPLAELDEHHAIRGREAPLRRLSGVSPALGDGVLVCPIGAGSTVAIDLATRTLLWAYDYTRRTPGREDGPLVNGIRVRHPGLGNLIVVNGQLVAPTPDTDVDRWRDDLPIIAGDHVILTPHDSDQLHCLDLRDGSVRWKQPRGRRLSVAGVVDGKVVVIGRREVEGLALDTGAVAWKQPLGGDAAPSGRGILTAGRLLLPIDTPAVVEIAIADGRIVGRSPSRGSSIPGNLVAYRGEVISQGVDSLDVFHQAAELETRIETARRDGDGRGWPFYWQAQLALERGDVRGGLDALGKANAGAVRLPPDALADAVLFAMDQDFAAAAPLWRQCLEAGGLTPTARTVVRRAIDGFLQAGDLAEAWAACRMLVTDADREAEADPLVDDGREPRLRITERRWLGGRLADLAMRAPADLRQEIGTALGAEVEAAATAAPAVRMRRLEALADLLGTTDAGLLARQRWIQETDSLIAAASGGNEATRTPVVRRDFLLLDLLRSGSPEQRSAAAATVDRVRGELSGGSAAAATAAAWPLGRVSHRQAAAERGAFHDDNRGRTIPVSVDADARSFFPAVGLTCDVQQGRLLFNDGFGRRIGDPVPLHSRRDMPAVVIVNQPSMMDASTIGRVVYVRSGASVAAFELGGPGELNRRLWVSGDKPAAAAVLPQAGWSRAVAGRGGRAGLRLGERIVEPDEPTGPTVVSGIKAAATGVPVYANRGLRLLDPVSGEPHWERHRLPPATDVLVDDEYLCLCSANGRGSLVLSMADGRTLHTWDVPDRRQRILTHGRHIVAVASAREGDADASRPQLVLHDFVRRTSTPLGMFSADARAVAVSPEQFAVLEPGGSLSVFDVPGGRLLFRTQLPSPLEEFDTLQVLPWQERLLVLAGRHDDAQSLADGDRFTVQPLQQMLQAGQDARPMSYSIWAVAAEDGRPLWDVPATVHRHCLHMAQSSTLPVLMFCRQIHHHNRDRDGVFLSVLCLDKRTGHAIFEDDRIPAQPHMLFGCDIVGDPDKHTITLRQNGAEHQRLTLEFTGGPLPPRPPYQATSRPPEKPSAMIEGLKRLLEALPIPPDR